MPDGFYIKPIDLNDEDELFFVFKCRRHPEIAKHLFKPPPDDFKVHRVYLRLNIPKKTMLYIAKVEAVPVGYCHAYGFDGNEVEIGFVVHPDWQGQGFGHAMVDALVAEVKKIFPGKQIHLDVKFDNVKAIRMYEKHGFSKTSVRMDLK